MTYLFLDLAKKHIDARKIPYRLAQIGLLVTRKQAKKLIAPEEPHGVYVLPEKKAAHSIICAVHEILLLHPDAKIAIVSERKKVQAAFVALQNEFPEAKLLCHHKLGKAVHTFLKHKKAKKSKSKKKEMVVVLSQPEQQDNTLIMMPNADFAVLPDIIAQLDAAYPDEVTPLDKATNLDTAVMPDAVVPNETPTPDTIYSDVDMVQQAVANVTNAVSHVDELDNGN